MTQPRLTVVIPTRNRPEALRCLLGHLAEQTAPPNDFDVVIVDDASDPPIGEITGNAFETTIVRRPSQEGAHASRRAGAHVASGERVLFLDDDVIPAATLIAQHASAEQALAVGPIFYPDLGSSHRPYQRFQTKLYAEYAHSVAQKGGTIPASELYICNASGPRDLFVQIFDAVNALVGHTSVAGDGWDEELLDFELRRADPERVAHFLPGAVAWHVDTKTLAQARAERCLHGAMQCRLLLSNPTVRTDFGSFRILTGGLFSLSTWRVRLFWAFPSLFRGIAAVFGWAVEHGPSRWVPAWCCYPPMAVAFWEGMHSVAPSYRRLRMSLLEKPAATKQS